MNILRELNSDYTVKLYYSFQTEDNLYLVMEYMNGGDFDNLLQNCAPMEEKYVKLYIAEIIVALEYLHSKNVFYRDMKPKNILIDSKGHLKLTDFGLSQGRLKDQRRKWIDLYNKEKEQTISKKERNSSKMNKKKCFVGTPHYLAPEIIENKNVSYSADWWAVGIIMYEMIVGTPPYIGDTPEEIFTNILDNKRDSKLDIGYNDDQISYEAADLIDKLLNRDPDKRLGRNGANEVKQHPFFMGLEWSNLRNIDPPFVPESVNPVDTSYFPTKCKFKITDVQPSRKEDNCASKQLGFNFDTKNAATLAQKNKDTYKAAYLSRMLRRMNSSIELDYEQEE